MSSPLSTAHNLFLPNPGPIIVCAIDAAIEQPLGPRIFITALPNGVESSSKNCGVSSSEKALTKTWQKYTGNAYEWHVHLYIGSYPKRATRVFGQINGP